MWKCLVCGNEVNDLQDVCERCLADKNGQKEEEYVTEELEIKQDLKSNNDIKSLYKGKKWEYLRLQEKGDFVILLDEKLNMLGAQGWELITSVASVAERSFSVFNYIHLIFKREII